MDKEIGLKVKELRNNKGLTLKELSQETDLSISYLSLLERGLTSITITSLKSIASVLDVELTYFFDIPSTKTKNIHRSYENEVFQMEKSKFIYSKLSGDIKNKVFDPMIATLLPGQSRDEFVPVSHEGQEFGYVLEGILTFLINGVEYELYPGDSVHIDSTVPHNWSNFTNKIVKVLYVITPTIFD